MRSLATPTSERRCRMTVSILAVFENGVLRPMTPLPLAEGETVQVTVTRTDAPTTPSEAERRIRAATTLQEWIDAANAAPPEDDEYDLLKALDENRKAAGDLRPLFPPEKKDITW